MGKGKEGELGIENGRGRGSEREEEKSGQGEEGRRDGWKERGINK